MNLDTRNRIQNGERVTLNLGEYIYRLLSIYIMKFLHV